MQILKILKKYRLALINYNNFYKNSYEQTTLKDVDNTSAGIDGWANYKSTDDIILELKKRIR